MRVLVDIGHPAHVHFFKNMIWALREKGHVVQITARHKEVAIALLTAYNLDFEERGEAYAGLFRKAIGMIQIDMRMLRIAREFNPDLLIGIHNPYIAHVAKILGKKSIIFNDTENVKISSLLTYPFATTICTPDCFRESVVPAKHVLFQGFKELAYLHPKYFQPDPGVLHRAGLSENEPFAVVRFISWGAIHDLALQGINRDERAAFVSELEKHARVVITSEGELEPGLEKYRLRIQPEDMHSILSFARLYIGEGGTMATEAAVLGTPAIHVEATADGRATGEMCGNFTELKTGYDLMYYYGSHSDALKKAVEILKNRDVKDEWARKRDALLMDKGDITAWMTDFVENYPRSFYEQRGGHVR